MSSIQLQPPLFSLRSFQVKPRKQLLKPNNPTWFSGEEPARFVALQSFKFRTKAINGTSTAPIVLIGLTSPAKSADLSSFLQISVLLFVLYWISNFVVPDLVSKYFQFDKVNENQTGKDDDDDDAKS